MTAEKKPSIDGANIDRFHELLDNLRQVFEPNGLRGMEWVDEVRDLLGPIICEKQQEAIEHQGQVIMAAIRGDLTAWPGCAPDWSMRPLGELDRRMAEVPA